METIKGLEKRETVEAEELGGRVGETVMIHGSIYKIRKMHGFAFVLLRTKRAILQCIYEEGRVLRGSKEGVHRKLEEWKEESCVRITAEVKAEPRAKNGFELQIVEAEILSEPSESSPIVINQKVVDASIDKLLHFRPVTLRNEKQRAIFKIQEGICRGFRRFLEQEHFAEIHTPKIVQAGAEGGANIFELQYFGEQAYLAQSPQFYKQMMVGVMERVFEIGPVFRAEKHDTSRHLNEYTSVDFEMGYIETCQDIMEMETRMLKFTFEFLKENYERELNSLQVNVPVVKEIPEIPFKEAKEWIAKSCQKETGNAEDLEPEEEMLLCELVRKETGSEFVFVTQYPSAKRPFYAMEQETHPEVTESFDLLFRGLEVTTGGQRIHTYEGQIEKMERRGMNTALFESYLMMHKYGMPPHGGLGLGLERFTARLLELENVRYAALFPRDIHRLQP